MFAIRFLPPPDDRAEITFGEFSERFPCDESQRSQLDLLWRSELRKLVDGASSVALVFDPRFAWVIYRIGEDCFVQQVFARDGDFSAHLATRVTVLEEGNVVSEWTVSLSEIEEFLHV